MLWAEASTSAGIKYTPKLLPTVETETEIWETGSKAGRLAYSHIRKGVVTSRTYWKENFPEILCC